MRHQPVPSSPLSQTPIKLIQPNQILAPLQPVALPTLSTLPEEDEPKPEEQEPEPEQQEPELDQNDPEQGQQDKSLNQINKSQNQSNNQNWYRKEFLVQSYYEIVGPPPPCIKNVQKKFFI